MPLRPVTPPQPTMARPPRLAVVVGHPRPGSRTQAVATRLAGLLGDAVAPGGRDTAVITVADLGPHLITPQSATGAAAVQRALEIVKAAQVLVVASPTFKGTFSGALKVFLDLLPRTGLTGVVAVPVMTAASQAYSHAVETHLRPLLVELGALVPVPGVCVLESELPYVHDVLDGWLRRSTPALLGVLDRMPAERA